MIHWAKSWILPACLALCAAIPGSIAFGQAPGGYADAASGMAAQALDLYNRGDLKGAAQLYQNILTTYPTAGAVPEAEFRLGFIQYALGDYTSSIATLNKITSPPATPGIKAAADGLIPQVLATQASKMAPDDPKRKAAFAAAIKQFGAFIQANPKSPDVETANYGLAMAAYQNQDYDTAVQSLQQNLTQFPSSESILDSEDLLAVILTSQGATLARDPAQHAAGLVKFNQAIAYLVDVITRRTDVALANDAQFQIAEVLFDRGNSEEGATQAKDLSHAIDAYRAVKPKDLMVQAQQARVQEILTRLQQAVLAGDQAMVASLQRLEDRENAKLQSLKSAPDQTLNAQLRIAACYYLLRRYDEARVLLHYLQPFTEDDNQKKQIQYYLVMTYSMQGVADKAVAAFNDFETQYKGDPLGESLPLALGVAYMGENPPQPDKAITYFQQQITLYPKSSLVNEALGQEAAALIGLKRYDEALAAYQKFLLSNPPEDQAAQAELGIANIYQATGKIADAVKQYGKVASTYPGKPQAEQSAFYAAGLEIQLDMKAALPMLQAFVKQYPDGQFTAQATMMIGQVQTALGDTAGATQTFQGMIDKYPKTEYGPEAYFQIAGILGKAGKVDEMVALLQKFIKAYPDNKNIFYAYDTVGQTEINKGQIAQAIATYSDMVDNHGDNPAAAGALYRVVDLWYKQATSLGEFLALTEPQRKTWHKDIDSSIASAEELLQKYPKAEEVGLALKALLADQEVLLGAKQITADDLDKYFDALADKFASDPSAKSRILFTLATFTYQTDPAKALAQMADAYNPSLVYAPADLDLYGQALIDQGKPADAYKLYQKIASDYPVPAGTQPAQAPLAIQDAQSTALFGMGNALEHEDKTADAAQEFLQLKSLYPWSPKVIPANYGIAKELIDKNELDDAQKLLIPLVSSRTAPVDLRARSLVLIGDLQEAKGNDDPAIDSYLKAAFFYGGVADAAAEGNFKGAQLLEKQASMLTESSTPKKSEQIAKAIKAYQTIVAKYPNSKYVDQAKARLDALGASSQ